MALPSLCFLHDCATTTFGLPSRASIKNYLPDLTRYERLREQIYSHSELSGQENGTAKGIADHLRSLEVFSVHVNIGGNEVAAVYANGSGNTLLLRADLEALPMQEQVDILFASKLSQIDREGVLQPVMHACEHAIHIVCLFAAADSLARMHSTWTTNEQTITKVNTAVRRILKADADASGATQEPLVVQIAKFSTHEQ